MSKKLRFYEEASFYWHVAFVWQILLFSFPILLKEIGLFYDILNKYEGIALKSTLLFMWLVFACIIADIPWKPNAKWAMFSWLIWGFIINFVYISFLFITSF